MKILRQHGGAALIAIGALGVIPAAQAALEEITVTAQRRATSLQETPIAVTALGTEDLARLNVDMGMDLGAAVPNMQTYQVTSNASAMQVFMRGAGIQNPGFIASESPVGLYVDGVIRSRLATANLDLTDIERIEVLRGPQGTLYGRNSIAGAVKVVTRNPEEEFWANGSLGYGNYDTRKLTASVGGQLIDGLGGSLSGLIHKREDGWITRGSTGGRDLGIYDNKAIRGKLNWFGSDNFRATLAAGYVKGTNDGYNGIPYGPGAESSPGKPLEGFYDSLVPDDSVGLGETEQLNVSLDLSWDIGSMTLNSITGYTDIDDVFRFDLNGGAVANFAPPPTFLTGVSGFLINSTSNNKSFSQEFTLAGASFEDKLDWITGVYYLREEGTQLYNPAFALSGDEIEERVETKTQSFAVFAEGTWAFTDKLSATLGGRYTKDKKDYLNNCTTVNSVAPPGTPVPRCLDTTFAPTNWTVDIDKSWSEFNPRLLVQYDFTDNIMTYGSLSSGFQSGGFQTLCFGLQGCTENIYDPQKVKTAEIGSKTDFFDNTFRINAALFLAKYDDIQQTSISTGSLPVVNVGKSEVTGLELELYWTPIDSINTYVIGALARDDISASAQAELPSTNVGRLPGLPERTLRVGGDWHPEINANWSFLVGADVNYVGAYYATINNTLLVDSYSRLNGRIGIDQPNGHWSIMLTGKNLTDEETVVSGIVGNGTNIRTPLPPIEYMLSVNWKY